MIFDIPSFKIADTVKTRTEAFMCNWHLFIVARREDLKLKITVERRCLFVFYKGKRAETKIRKKINLF